MHTSADNDHTHNYKEMCGSWGEDRWLLIEPQAIYPADHLGEDTL